MSTSTSKAALYLRSSKDRSDVSIDAQRRDLQALAKTRSLPIAAEFVDVVESGKDEHRPGFQSLIRGLKDRGRHWDHLLLLDTSRLSRRRHIAHAFKHECQKLGVKILYVKLPEVDPISQVILESVFEAMDEVHSLMSREKGLAGMAENVRQGWRAGGKAPAGYQLERVPTGAVREGEAVLKSRLVRGPDADVIAEYLRDRAAGISRMVLVRRLGLDMAESSLVGLEWNALTYAGHTVWNVHAERIGGHYKGGAKRRPRSDWLIQRDTHEPLIDDAAAEALLSRLEVQQAGRPRRSSARHLLTGVLVTPAGPRWQGDGIYYRATGRKTPAADVDRAVLDQIRLDLRSTRFVDALLKQARLLAADHQSVDVLHDKRAAVAQLDAKILKAGRMALEAPSPRVFYELGTQMEKERAALERELEALEHENAQRAMLSTVTERDVLRVLDGIAEDMETLDREILKDLLAEFAEQIVLNPADLTCQIRYRIPALRGDKVASPGRSDLIPLIRIWSELKVA